jgi:hypothetical protein
VHADLGENGLRVFYQPVWNAVLRGFGSHEQGPSTRQSGRSAWDTVHPGRRRTFGSEAHDRDRLIERTQGHIARQIASYGTAPWQRSPGDESGTSRRRLATDPMAIPGHVPYLRWDSPAPRSGDGRLTRGPTERHTKAARHVPMVCGQPCSSRALLGTGRHQRVPSL